MPEQTFKYVKCDSKWDRFSEGQFDNMHQVFSKKHAPLGSAIKLIRNYLKSSDKCAKIYD